MPAKDSTESVLERIDAILDVVAASGPATLTEITDATGLPRTTVHRLLDQMVRSRWILRIHNDYELGVRPFQLGAVSRQGHWFHRIARPHLEELHRATRLIVHLGFRDGPFVAWWDRVGDAPVKYVPTFVGGRHEIHRTASGRALLSSSALDDSSAGDWSNAAARFTATLDELSLDDANRRRALEEFQRFETDGYCLDLAESLPHLGCVGTTVIARPRSTSDGSNATASISICGPRTEVETDKTLPASVLSTAHDILRDVARSSIAMRD